MENTKNSSLAKLFPVMLCFFAMGFVDLVGIASNYVKADNASKAGQKILVTYSATLNKDAFVGTRTRTTRQPQLRQGPVQQRPQRG